MSNLTSIKLPEKEPVYEITVELLGRKPSILLGVEVGYDELGDMFIIVGRNNRALAMIPYGQVKMISISDTPVEED